MTINKEQLKQVMNTFNIDYDEGVLYLLSIYFGLQINEVRFEKTIKQINFSKIVEFDFENDCIKWNIKLFKEEKNENEWEWLEEYRSLFISIRKDCGGSLTAIKERMKEFFKKNKNTTKEDVIAATKMYLRNVNDIQYLQQADYFIKKGTGSNITSKLEQYINLYYQEKSRTIPTNLNNLR